MSIYGLGGGLVGAGINQRETAMQTLGQAADQEQQRNLQNQQLERSRKAGNVQLGASAGALAGAQFGSAIGPWGTVIGGLVGAVAGGLF